MSQAAASVLSLALAVVAGAWAGLLVMVQEAPKSPIPPGSMRRQTEWAGLDRLTRIARIALLTVAGVAAAQVVGWWYQKPLVGFGRAALAVAFLYLLAESLPRSAAVLMPKLAKALAPVARRTVSPFTPLVGVALAVERVLGSVLPSPEVETHRFGKAHRDMLHGVFSLGETTVEEVMTPRLDITAIEYCTSWDSVVELLSRSEHARLPVYTDDIDNVEGILFAKDLTSAIVGVSETPDDWREYVRPASFVPETKPLTAQLRDFQRTRSGIAIVVDEFGGTSGLITLEDVLEEIVGEIHGEYDVEIGPVVEREGDDRFWVDGRLALDDLSELLGENVERDEVTTVGGVVYAELGHVPKPGEEFRIGSFRAVVEQVVRRRVVRVHFERIAASAQGDSNEEDEA